jgi:hypothetical protein
MLLHKKSIKIPIYKGYIVIIISNSVQLVNEQFPYLDVKEEIYASTFSSQFKRYPSAFILLNFNHDEKLDHGVIAHEVFHASNIIMKDRQLLPDVDNDESQAYLIQWISNQVYDFIDFTFKKQGYNRMACEYFKQYL